MNILEADCLEIDYGIESAAMKYQLIQLEINSQIIQADDYWKVSAPAYNSSGKLQSFFAADFVSKIINHPEHHCTIKGYTKKDTGEYFSKNQLVDIRDKSGYKIEYVSHTIKLDNSTTVIYEDGRLYIQKHKLQGFAGNRVDSMVDSLVKLVDLGILAYNSRTGGTPAHLRDAMRHVLCRKPYFVKSTNKLSELFTHNAYEWQATFDSKLSAIVAPALQRSAVYTVDGTCYQWPEKYEAGTTKGKRIECRIKIYNVSAVQDDRKNKPYEYIVGDIFKFEITFTHAFFTRHRDASISDFKSQYDIFALLNKHIAKQFRNFVLKKLTTEELAAFYLATGTSKGNFMSKLTNPASLQVNIVAEVNAIKERQLNLESSFADFKAEMKTDFSDFKLKQETDIKNIRADLGLHEANFDKRKLRLVK